jgi:hypothetical protein
VTQPKLNRITKAGKKNKAKRRKERKRKRENTELTPYLLYPFKLFATNKKLQTIN